MRNLVVYCADIGSVKAGKFGWARGRAGADPFKCGTSISDLSQTVADDLRAGELVALGFEAPMFVPLREDPEKLTTARRGDGNRSWSAGAGCAVLATGLAQVIWVLKEVRRILGEAPPSYLRWEKVPAAGPALYLWEAFVSGIANRPPSTDDPCSGIHTSDAKLAVQAFLSALPNVDHANAVREDDVHSLIGAALLRTGWTKDVRVLEQACLVIRARGGSLTDIVPI